MWIRDLHRGCVPYVENCWYLYTNVFFYMSGDYEQCCQFLYDRTEMNRHWTGKEFGRKRSGMVPEFSLKGWGKLWRMSVNVIFFIPCRHWNRAPCRREVATAPIGRVVVTRWQFCGVAPDRAGQYSVCLRTARRDGRFPAAWFLSRFVPQVKTIPGDRPLCWPVCIGGCKELMEITCLRHGSDYI